MIGAWNYPYQLALAPVVAAIAAGNTVILKPSEIPSETSNALAVLLNKAFNPSFLKVIEGGIPETTALLNQKFDKIFFTGSTTVGKIIYKAAAKHLTPVTLELGGKSPAIIAKDCNIKMTAKRLVWGKFLNAGQTCIAPDYCYVDKKIEAKFLDACTAEILKTNYAFENDNYVQIINDNNFERLVGLIDTAKVYHGGEIDKVNRYIAPTILKDVTFEDQVMQEEIFGPILPIISYDSLDTALKKVQSLPKPLSCYVFTNNRNTKQKVLERISFGGGAVNDTVMHITNPHLPFGGVGASGIGKYHGEEGFRIFSSFKGVLEKPNWFESPFKYAPYTKEKLAIIKQLFKLQ